MVLEFEPRDQEEVTTELKTKFEHFNSFRQNYEKAAIDDYKLYRGYKDDHDTARKEKDKKPNRSNLHIPYTYEVMDTIRARIVSSFFTTRPYMDFIPQPEGGEAHQLYASEQKANVAAALVDMQLDKNNIYRTFYDYITSLLIFPAAIMSVGWRYEQKPVRRRIKIPDILETAMGPRFNGWHEEILEAYETIWDDNEISLVDFFDFWPDPHGKDIDDCRGVFQREWLTEEQLEDRLDFLWELQEGVVYPIRLDKLRGQTTGLESGTQERMSEVGISTGGHDIFRDIGPDSSKNLYEVLHYWEDNRHSMLINRTAVAYDGPSPYWRHRKKPFVVESYEPLPGEFYGMSGTRIINHLQHELNTQRNQRIDNVSFVMNRMWKVLNGHLVDEDELVSQAGGIIHVDDMNAVEPIVTPDVTSSSYNEEQVTKSDMESTVGAPPVVRGAEGQRKETATAQSIKASGAGIRFEVKIRLYETLGISRMAELMDMNNQQFISEERMVKLGPEESVQWRMVEPDEVVGEFDYRPAGSSLDPAANRELRRAQLSEMMQFLLETGNPYLDIYELTKAYVESFDLRNPQKFLIPKEEVQQQMAEEAALAQQQEQGQAAMAGGQPPMPALPPPQGGQMPSPQALGAELPQAAYAGQDVGRGGLS